jgi:hypothetical protein
MFGVGTIDEDRGDEAEEGGVVSGELENMSCGVGNVLNRSVFTKIL